ncbi:hypothetical protein, partial [Steroidobacter agaridevorans]|uniref:hypothetical protein n=1 Tax=Steroidobacter agaridevorans TaxID=2695856 RepID=UPI001F22B332
TLSRLTVTAASAVTPHSYTTSRDAICPDDDATANAYWNTFRPTASEDAQHLEILANSALYFPDWQSFPTLDMPALAEWQRLRTQAT